MALRVPDVWNVVGDDGCNDAAERRADDSVIRARQPPEPCEGWALRAHRGVRRRISPCLGRVQRCCRGAALGAGAGGAAVADYGEQQRGVRRCAAPHGRGLSAFTAEACLPAPLPRADRFHLALLAGWPPRRVANGRASRSLLPRLLLGAYGAAFLRRRHEPLLERRIGAVRAP